MGRNIEMCIRDSGLTVRDGAPTAANDFAQALLAARAQAVVRRQGFTQP